MDCSLVWDSEKGFSTWLPSLGVMSVCPDPHEEDVSAPSGLVAVVVRVGCYLKSARCPQEVIGHLEAAPDVSLSPGQVSSL